MRFAFWQRWLLIGSILTALFGLGMALLSATPLFDVFNRLIDPAFWGESALPAEAIQFRGWAYALLGATMMGWGITLAFLAHYPFRRREAWAWWAVAVGMGGWYVVDTSASLAFGVTFNAVFNTVLLVLIGGLPLIFTYRTMTGAAS
jgi:hypothetical protein